MSPRRATPTTPASSPATADELRRWEHLAAARVTAADGTAERLKQAEREAAQLIEQSRRAGQAGADRRRADVLADAETRAGDIRSEGTRRADALTQTLLGRLPDLLTAGAALVLPRSPARRRTER